MAGLALGHWTDPDQPTGCTVVLGPAEGMMAAIDVRGGAAGTFNTELLHPQNLVEKVHAVVLTGGSAFGLSTTSGVMRFLEERGTGLRYGGAVVPIVVGAVLFDRTICSGPPPGPDAGYAAAAAASAVTDRRGSVGAGAGATVGKLLGRSGVMRGGLGMASRRVGPHTVSALAVVNSVGNVVDRQGRTVAGARLPDGAFDDWVQRTMATGELVQLAGANTTLGIVATSAPLTRDQAGKVAQMAHDGFARAIQPAHTMSDGDLVFALSVPIGPVDEVNVSAIGAIAAEAMIDAILDGVVRANGLPGIPSARDLGLPR